ncbi:uncharacterized protein LOC107274050 isoform X1 [Cephus cinctus]|uniref:Uncharacterized protein LOC107274050 isoform X1 n=1 Tax=Cephus cinctus TaxID=211228 RepID=A0AAJ7CDS5_CEPCN|nr:uncharacterized protein LOC107274050 isoform X1 [Cephus cinctus]
MDDNILEKLQKNNVLPEDLQKKLSDMVQKYRNMDEDEKIKFHEEAKHMFKNNLNTVVENSGSSYYNIFSLAQFYVVLVAVLLIILVFVFFGFKLYKSLKDREKKREEKKRNKQLRKKK